MALGFGYIDRISDYVISMSDYLIYELKYDCFTMAKWDKMTALTRKFVAYASFVDSCQVMSIKSHEITLGLERLCSGMALDFHGLKPMKQRL